MKITDGLIDAVFAVLERRGYAIRSVTGSSVDGRGVLMQALREADTTLGAAFCKARDEADRLRREILDTDEHDPKQAAAYAAACRALAEAEDALG